MLYFSDLKNHEYFNEIDWNAVVERKSDSGPLPNVQTNRTVEQIESKEVLFQSHESETLTRDEYYQIRGNVAILFSSFLIIFLFTNSV